MAPCTPPPAPYSRAHCRGSFLVVSGDTACFYSRGLFKGEHLQVNSGHGYREAREDDRVDSGLAVAVMWGRFEDDKRKRRFWGNHR